MAAKLMNLGMQPSVTDIEERLPAMLLDDLAQIRGDYQPRREAPRRG